MLHLFNEYEIRHLLMLFGNELDYLNQHKEILMNDYDDLGVPAWFEKMDDEINFVYFLSKKIEAGEPAENLTKREKKHIMTIVASEHASLEKRLQIQYDTEDELPVPHWTEKLNLEIKLTESILKKVQDSF